MPRGLVGYLWALSIAGSWLLAGLAIANDDGFNHSSLACQQQYRWQANTATVLTKFAGNNHSQASNPPQHTQLFGLLAIRELASGPSNAHPEWQWWAVKADNVVWLDALGDKRPDSQFELAFAFALNQQGQIQQFWYPQGTSSEQQRVLAGLAYYFQYQRAPSPVSHYLEADSNGTLQVQYMRSRPAPWLPEQWTRLKLGYVATNTHTGGVSGQPASNPIKLQHAQARWQLANCFYQSWQSDEQWQVDLAENQWLTSQTANLQLLKAPLGSTLFSLPAQLAAWRDFVATPLTEAQRLALSKQLQVLLAKDLTTIPADQLAALLAQFEAVLANDVIVVLQQGLLSDQSQMRLFNALGQLDSRASNNLLLNILSQPFDELSQFRAVRALSQGRNALTVGQWEQLQQLLLSTLALPSSELSSSMVLAMGTLLKQRPSDDGSLLMQTTLRDQLQQVSNPAQQAQLLLAIGNSADNAFLDSVIAAESNNERSEKARAYALAQLPDERALVQLQQLAANAAFVSVQRQALSGLANFELAESQQQWVAGQLQHTDSEMRFAALQVLKKQPQFSANQQWQQQIRQQLQHESSRRNFQAMTEALHGQPVVVTRPTGH